MKAKEAKKANLLKCAAWGAGLGLLMAAVNADFDAIGEFGSPHFYYVVYYFVGSAAGMAVLLVFAGLFGNFLFRRRRYGDGKRYGDK